MINLLPAYEKQELKLEEVQIKISIVFAYFLCCLGLLILIFFLLNHYIVLETVEFDNAVLTKTQELESYQFQDFKEATVKVNQKLAMVQLFQQDEIFISPFFEEVIALTEQGITFTSVSFIKNTRLIPKEEPERPIGELYAGVNLAGIALTREVLYSFKKILEGQKHFQQVYFSPDSWTESQDASFSVNFEIIYQSLPL